jgi:hypothetical protein
MPARREFKFTEELQQLVLDMLADGYSVQACCEAAGITNTTYQKYRNTRPEFKQATLDAKASYHRSLAERFKRRSQLAQDYVDRMLAERLFNKTKVTRTDGGGYIIETIETEEQVEPQRWILERYLPLEMKVEEITEEIVVKVDFGDDSAPNMDGEKDDGDIEDDDIDEDEGQKW